MGLEMSATPRTLDGHSNGTIGQQPASEEATLISMDILIIGTGPAGASLACFLASHGESTSNHKATFLGTT